MEERFFWLDQGDWDDRITGWRNEAAISKRIRITRIEVNNLPIDVSYFDINYSSGIIRWRDKTSTPERVMVWFTDEDAGKDKPPVKYEWLNVLSGSAVMVALVSGLVAKLPDFSGSKNAHVQKETFGNTKEHDGGSNKIPDPTPRKGGIIGIEAPASKKQPIDTVPSGRKDIPDHSPRVNRPGVEESPSTPRQWPGCKITVWGIDNDQFVHSEVYQKMKALQFAVTLPEVQGSEQRNLVWYPNAQMREAAVAIKAMLQAAGYGGVSVMEAEPAQPNSKRLIVRLTH